MALDEPKHWIALIIGLIILALGLIPLLAEFGVIGFGLGFLSGIMGAIAAYIVMAIGFYLLIDAFMEDDHVRTISVIVAILVIAIGLVTTLNASGTISFGIPFISQTVFNIIFAIEGLFLIIAAFHMNL